MEKTQKTPAQRQVVTDEAEQDMAVIIRDTPPTYDWGWFSREEPRMHLQAVDKDHRRLHYKVWLEEKGRRVMQAEPGIPAKVLKVLEREVVKQRETIEAYWAAFMIAKGWLQVQLRNGLITLTAYGHTPNRFQRTISLAEMIPNEEVARKVTSQDVALNEEFAFLEIFPRREEGKRIHEPLANILWVN